MNAKDHGAKDVSLHQAGALNPHPEGVTDADYLSSDFFDPRDLVQVKYEMLRRVERDGRSVTEAADSFGLSRTTFYEARAALTANGLSGLLAQRPGPRKAHKLSDEVVEFLDRAIEQDYSLRPKDLARLVQVTFSLSVHPRSIERALERHQKKRRRQTP